jgi:geranylgeranyl reductase
VLRGQALAPASYRPVPSVVRSEEEVETLLAAPTAATASEAASPNAPAVASPDRPVGEEREPALASR